MDASRCADRLALNWRSGVAWPRTVSICASAGWRLLGGTGLLSLTALPAKHYLQEDQSPALAVLITRYAGTLCRCPAAPDSAFS